MNNKHEENSHDDDAHHQTVQQRRNFLKKSKYAVYATPLVTALIINSAEAKSSKCKGKDCPSK